MNRTVKLSKATTCTVLILLAGLFLAVWPLRLVRQSPVVQSLEKDIVESDPISVEHNATQMFVAKGDRLEAVELYLSNDMYGQTITFRLYDGAYQQIWEKFLVVNEQNTGVFYRIPVNLEVTDENLYYFTAEGLTQDLYLAYEKTSENGITESGIYTWGGEEVPDTNIVARYYYSERMAWWQILCIGLFCAVLGAAVWLGLPRLFAAQRWERQVKVLNYVKVLGNPLLLLVTVLGLLSVWPLRKFGGGAESYGVYLGGILLFAVLGFWALNHKRRGRLPEAEYVSFRDRFRKHWTDWLQSLFFAGALWGCIRYMNALYNYQQNIAFMQVLIFLALALLTMAPRRELAHWLHLLYLPAAGFIAYRRYLPYKGIPEEEDTAFMTAWFGVIAGLFLIHFIWLFLSRRIRWKQVALPYTAAAAVLFGALILFRNTRGWPVVLAVMFGCCYLFYLGWPHKERFLTNLENGILLHFLLALLFTLFRRPYHAWYMYRYSGVFHTVTETAVYLTVMLCAVLVLFLRRYRSCPTLAYVWKELALFAAGIFYLFITLSRTGYLATFVMCAVILLFVCLFCYRQKVTQLLRQAGLLLLCSLALFPVLFTAQRILPAVYNDPYIFPLEEMAYGDYTVKRDEPWDSDNYMTVPRFLRVLSVKLGDEKDTALLLRESLQQLRYGDQVRALPAGEPVADADYVPEEEPRTDVSNGRISLFRLYIKNWNLWGHDEMGVPDPDNENIITTHAHNTYLQVIHDHGLVVGLLYLLFGIFTAVWLFRYTKEKIKDEPYAALPLALFVAFAAASLVEWVFFPCNPMGFTVMTALTPLICFKKDKGNGKKEKKTVEL